MTKPRRKLTPAEEAQADELREKIKLAEKLHYTASALHMKRKLRALLGGYDLEAKRYER